MKRTLSAATVPFLLALGACSGGSKSSTAQPPATSDAGGVGRTDGGPAAEGGDNGDDGGAPGDDSNAPTEFDTTLSGTDVVPPVQTGATGTAKFLLQPDNITLTYTIDLTNVPNPTAVSLHIGGPGEVAGVTHALVPVGALMAGQLPLTLAEQDALAADMMYLDVETQSHVGGEVRGQLVPPGSTVFIAMPTGAQEISPPVMSAYSAHASFILSADQGTVRYHIATDATPTDLTVNSGIGGLVGQGVYPLAGALDGTIQLGDARPLQSGQLYLNIVTQAHPTGELRGQIVLPGETLFTAVLSGQNEVPSAPSRASGAAQAILSPTHNSIRYQVVVSGTVPTAVELFNAPPTMNAPQPMYQLTLGPTGAQGTLDMTASDAAQLGMGGVYVNVLSQSVPSGELRGQLARQ